MEGVHTKDGAFVSNEIGANEVTEQDLKRSLFWRTYVSSHGGHF